MTDADEPFVRAVCADPDDDLPRLIFADRLEETSGSVACPECRGHGELVAWCEITKENDREVCPACQGTGSVSDGRRERGEFIRTQIELANHPIEQARQAKRAGIWRISESERVEALRRRERKLLDAYARTWKSDWHGMPYQAWLTLADVQWSRGFIARITLTAADLLAHAAAVFGAQPLEQVTLTDLPIHQSGGNDTYYVGGLGMFPQQYWQRLENLPTRSAAGAALSAVALEFGRSAAGLPAWGPAVRADGSGAYVEGGRAGASGGPTLWPGGA